MGALERELAAAERAAYERDYGEEAEPELALEVAVESRVEATQPRPDRQYRMAFTFEGIAGDDTGEIGLWGELHTPWCDSVDAAADAARGFEPLQRQDVEAKIDEAVERWKRFSGEPG